MNVGQILETHLGWAAHTLGKQIAELAEQMESANEVRELFKARFAGTAALNQLLDLDDEQTIAGCGWNEARHLVRHGSLRRRT